MDALEKLQIEMYGEVRTNMRYDDEFIEFLEVFEQ
jgi:hypothetical protein